MSEKFKVVQIGLGPMGLIISDLILSRKNLELVSAVDIDPKKVGSKLGVFLKENKNCDLVIINDAKKAIDMDADVLFISTASDFRKIAPLVKMGLNSGKNVISICEELTFPLNKHSELCCEIDKLALEKNLTVMGTGINPGFLMDLLPVVLTAPCQIVKSITVRRVMNSSRRRVPFQKKIGTGMTVGEFNEKINNGSITGHVGLYESVYVILDTLGWKCDNFKEFPTEGVVTDKEITTSYGDIVKKGEVIGLKSKAIAYKNGADLVVLDFQAYAGEHEEYDEIIIDGTPKIKQIIQGGVHGDSGTSGMAVNLIAKIGDAKKGLLTLKDFPLLHCTENLWKVVNKRKRCNDVCDDECKHNYKKRKLE